MKKVFSNSHDVIHLFAQRTQEEARSSNVFFDGNKIYSYGHHYLLAEFIQNKKNETAIYINDSGYSSTTSGHISAVTQATRQFKQFFAKQIELNHVLDAIETNVEKLQTARKKELYINPSIHLFERLNEFISWSDNENMKRDERYLKILLLIEVVKGGEYTEYLKNEEKRIKTEEKRKLANLKKTLKENIKKFRNYEINRFNSNEDFVRLSKDALTVETSQNVSVDVKEAKTLYKMIVAKKDIKGFKISNYTVTSINGTLKIGCHNINIESMHEVGIKILNL